MGERKVRIVFSEVSSDPMLLVFAPVPFSFRQGVLAVAKGGSGMRRGLACGKAGGVRGVQRRMQKEWDLCD